MKIILWVLLLLLLAQILHGILTEDFQEALFWLMFLWYAQDGENFFEKIDK